MSAEAPERSGRHLSIGEVLAQLRDEFPDVTISKIRFLESQGLIDPERTPSGYRKFYPPDLERLRWILFQQREHFLPLRVIKDRLDAYGPSGAPSVDSMSSANGSHPETALPAPVTRSAPAGSPPSPARIVRRDAPTPPTPTRPAIVAHDDRPVLPFDDVLDEGEDLAEELGPVRASDSEPTPTDMTRSELLEATGLSDAQLAALEEFGIVVPLVGHGELARYDDEALTIAGIGAGFYGRGIEARHLKMYWHFAEREAALFGQVLIGYVRQRNPAARTRLQEDLEDLARLGRRLRTAMLRRALGESLSE